MAALLEGGRAPAEGRNGLVGSVTALAIDEAQQGGLVELSERWRRLGLTA